MKILKEEEIDKMSLKRLRSYHKTIIIAESRAYNAYRGDSDSSWWGSRWSSKYNKEQYDSIMEEIMLIKKIVLKNLYKYRQIEKGMHSQCI